MGIDIRNLQKKVRLDAKKVRRCAEAVLDLVGEEDTELSLLFVDDRHIRRLNSKYRKVDSATDVLAFPIRSFNVLGDVVISAETAKRAAHKREIPIHKEICLYIVHGILHLVGYKDKRPDERRRMRLKEGEVLAKCNSKV